MQALRSLFLRRQRRVFLPDAGAGTTSAPWDAAAREASLLELGFVLSQGLTQGLRALPHAQAEGVALELREALAAELGADRQHDPLFQAFPEAPPQLAQLRYKERVLAWLAREPLQPCLACERKRRVEVMDPCGHLVCRDCWEELEPGACPACGQRMAEATFVPRPTPKAPPERVGRALTVLHLGGSLAAAAEGLVRQLLARRSPLSPQDRSDLQATLLSVGPQAQQWFPAQIAVKESAAVAYAALLEAAPAQAGSTLEAAGAHLRTATDVLRLLAALGGQDPGLTGPARAYPSLPRPQRRALLELLGRQAPATLLEDLARHPERWKRAGERLHPFERARALPQVALGFAVLRRTPLRGALGARLREAAREVPEVTEVDGRLRFRGWGHAVEEALRAGDLSTAVARLRERPGELLRRVDLLLRRVLHEHPDLEPELLQALSDVAPRAAGPLLLQTWAALAPRSAPFARRVFFPKGQVSRVWGQPDDRPLLTPEAIARTREVLARELCRRAASRPPLAGAVLDPGLADLLVPLGERNAARALVDVPRGSQLDLPHAGRLRLFLHWCEVAGQRVDLDLSLALYDADWTFVGLCDYTQLRLEDEAAVHSGDFTSAPPPKGASEFLDLDREKLAALGAVHAVVVVFSFNDVAFDRMQEAFAGCLDAHGPTAQAFDPRDVLQRFDLQGDAKVALPLVLDLEGGRLRWLGVNLSPEAGIHSVRSHRGKLAQLARDLEAYFAVGARPTLWDVASLCAAARAPEVQVAGPSGVRSYRRQPGEAPFGFWTRVHAQAAPDAELPTPQPPPGPVLVAGPTDFVAPPPAAGQVYALWWRANLPEGVTRLAASDLLTDLAPAQD